MPDNFILLYFLFLYNHFHVGTTLNPILREVPINILIRLVTIMSLIVFVYVVAELPSCVFTHTLNLADIGASVCDGFNFTTTFTDGCHSRVNSLESLGTIETPPGTLDFEGT